MIGNFYLLRSGAEMREGDEIAHSVPGDVEWTPAVPGEPAPAGKLVRRPVPVPVVDFMEEWPV